LGATKCIAIIGGGVAGVTTAYFLGKIGYKVNLYDYNGIAEQCSYANGGQLSVCNAETWNTYSNIIKGIKWLSQPDAPLAFRPDLWSWSKVKWIAGFLGATITNTYDHNTRKTIQYSLRSRELMYELIDEIDINFHQQDCGILHIYKNQKSWDKARKTLDKFKNSDWGRVEETSDLTEKYNIVSDNVVGATITKEDGVGDIHEFCLQLHQYMTKNFDYELIKQKVVKEDLIQLKKSYDEVIVCAGAYTPQFLPKLNIYPIKGYSITYDLVENAPTVSILDDDKKIVASTFTNNVFRVAGTAELAGWDHKLRQDRINPLVKWVEENTFVNKDSYEKWACLRPMTPNMLPIVDKIDGVWVNSGAGHLGWTMGLALAEKLTNKVLR
jgi:D-amino-acid dehydrogenase